MAKFTPRGSAEYQLKLAKLGGEKLNEIIGKAVYAGADIVANKIRENINSLPAVNDVEGTHAWRAKRKAPLTKKAKIGLQEGLGISPMKNDDGYINVKIGFDGYNKLITEQYPKGQPNVLVARVTESGTSISQKRPFVRPAVEAVRVAAETKMDEIVNEEIAKIMKE